MHHPSPPVYRLLFTVYCLLSTVYCLLSTVYCLLFTDRGGEGGIRTLEAFTPTRFPIVRTKPDYATSPYGNWLLLIPILVSGEGGIRTHGGPKPTAVFETAPIVHSGTSPATNDEL